MCISFLVLQICGGSLGSSGSSEKCFQFKNSVWEEYASMKEKRYLAAAVMHNDKLHVFGGTYYSGGSHCKFIRLNPKKRALSNFAFQYC